LLPADKATIYRFTKLSEEKKMSALVYPPLTNSQISALPADGRYHAGLIARLAATLRLWHRRSRERQALAELSPRELADFGATTADVYRELNTPFWKYTMKYPPF
jgi:uncharacterized protein YjiS (DUF1127 family)